MCDASALKYKFLYLHEHDMVTNTKIKRSYIKELTRAQEMQSPSDGVSVPGCGQVGAHLPHRTAKPLAWN